MKMEPQRTCPTCGNELSGAVEFCPVCMLRKGLAGTVESGESSVFEDTVNPTTHRATQRFEHYELVTATRGSSARESRPTPRDGVARELAQPSHRGLSHLVEQRPLVIAVEPQEIDPKHARSFDDPQFVE